MENISNNHVVLKNWVNGLFITTTDNFKFYDLTTNHKVDPNTEKSVLIEFNYASFAKVNKEVEKAETPRFIFYKYTEDAQDNITWVETKGEQAQAQ